MLRIVQPRRSRQESNLFHQSCNALGAPRRYAAAATILSSLGPAVVASVAYIDPGNFATNIQAGARYGYTLLWVVVLANAVAMLFQALSAKLGVVTGRNLAEICRERFPPWIVGLMWIVSEIGAMATDLAEMLGAAVGLMLLLGLPLILGMAITAGVTWGILVAGDAGRRTLELLIGASVALVSLCYLAELIIAPPDWPAFVYHSVTPLLTDAGSVRLAVGIVGATVMPHVLYLHSSLTQATATTAGHGERRRLLSLSNGGVLVALGIVGLVNMAMIAMAAAIFHDGIHNNVAAIETAYQTLAPLAGGAAAAIFLLSLLASGFSSSVVGVMAGQVVMQGFVRFRIPLWVRRLAVLVPACAIVAAGVGSTDALVLSQVVLSFVLPFPLIALLLVTSSRAIMGDFANGSLTITLGAAAAALVLGLNVLLVAEAAGFPMPFLPA